LQAPPVRYIQLDIMRSGNGGTMFAPRRVLLSLAVLLGLATSAAAEPVNVFAAASLKNALDAVSEAWKVEAGKETRNTYAASSALAKQIEQAAPADVFISADLDWMNYVAEKKLIKEDTRKVPLGNALVLVAAQGSGTKLELGEGADLAGALAGGKLALGDVKAVPAGKYAKAALEKLGLWASVEKSLAQSENVRAALALVARGEARLGIVYATDARAEDKVEVAGTFPEDSHPPIVYPAAVILASKNPDAEAFVTYLSSPKAQEIFTAQGFTILN
jgi:molybdate transport system substrate-binding protein